MKEKKEYQQFPKYCQDKKKIRETLQKILCKIGFIWKKAENKRKILMERPDIILEEQNF